jgi:uncharacterized protein (DUF1697 family)
MNKTTYVAFLRGINVGGKRKIPMNRLAGLFADVGCIDVKTHLQSGNVFFGASVSLVKTLPEVIAASITDEFGCTVTVLIRSAKDLEEVLRDNPFLKRGVDPAILHVAFLADVPGAKQVAELDNDRSPGDSFDVRGRHIYLYLPNGVARTKLTNDYFDHTLRTVSTLRNWNTVQKLLEIVRQG